jgi:hypothetical protein
VRRILAAQFIAGPFSRSPVDCQIEYWAGLAQHWTVEWVVARVKDTRTQMENCNIFSMSYEVCLQSFDFAKLAYANLVDYLG